MPYLSPTQYTCLIQSANDLQDSYGTLYTLGISESDSPPWLHSQKLENFDPAEGLASVQTASPTKMASEWHTSFCQKQGKDSEFPYVHSFVALSQNPDLGDSRRMCLSVAALSPVTLCFAPSDFLDNPCSTFHIHMISKKGF